MFYNRHSILYLNGHNFKTIHYFFLKIERIVHQLVLQVLINFHENRKTLSILIKLCKKLIDVRLVTFSVVWLLVAHHYIIMIRGSEVILGYDVPFVP